jgi:hypothetical protein
VGVAVKVTLVPVQIEFPVLADILTLAATLVFTVATTEVRGLLMHPALVAST